MDHATPNLPSRDFEVTSRFYAALGFSECWKDEGWMILQRGGVKLEFFRFPELDPATSGFSCCLRLDDAEAFIAACRKAGVPEERTGWPRFHPMRREDWGGRVGALVDPDCTLLRVVENIG